MNEGSSRSHAVFTIAIEQKIITETEGIQDLQVEDPSKEPAAAASEEHISAKFHFVDLAGSERIKKTGATG
jgi:Kinesin motor domain